MERLLPIRREKRRKLSRQCRDTSPARERNTMLSAHESASRLPSRLGTIPPRFSSPRTTKPFLSVKIRKQGLPRKERPQGQLRELKKDHPSIARKESLSRSHHRHVSYKRNARTGIGADARAHPAFGRLPSPGPSALHSKLRPDVGKRPPARSRCRRLPAWDYGLVPSQIKSMYAAPSSRRFH